ncbi:MAG: hypothetical protein ABSE47_15615 [Acidimicrobiales bacterium]
MVRLRPAAAKAVAAAVPHPPRQAALRALAFLALVIATGCWLAAVRSEPSNLGAGGTFHVHVQAREVGSCHGC